MLPNLKTHLIYCAPGIRSSEMVYAVEKIRKRDIPITPTYRS